MFGHWIISPDITITLGELTASVTSLLHVGTTTEESKQWCSGVLGRCETSVGVIINLGDTAATMISPGLYAGVRITRYDACSLDSASWIFGALDHCEILVGVVIKLGEIVAVSSALLYAGWSLRHGLRLISVDSAVWCSGLLGHCDTSVGVTIKLGEGVAATISPELCCAWKTRCESSASNSTISRSCVLGHCVMSVGVIIRLGKTISAALSKLLNVGVGTARCDSSSVDILA